MNKFLITVKEEDSNNAGPKATNDIITFLSEKNSGYQTIDLKFNLHSKLKKIFYKYWSIPRFFKKNNFDTIVFQYPAYSEFLMVKIMDSIKKYTDAKLYLIIHDIESLRMYQDRHDYVQHEIQWLNQADGLVVHNQHMQRWLKDKGVTGEMVNLNLFDYKNEQTLNNNTKFSRSICFAGNLKKAQFLSLLTLKNTLNVFGPNPQKDYNKGVNYKGQFSPDELPKYLTENFGLVWDGTSLDRCDGVFGEYMKYNSPHKVSLYLSSGIPIIIWKQAALADYITNNNLGIAIDNLENLDQVLDNISETQFSNMKQNAVNIASKLRTGQFTLSALKTLEQL